MPAPEATDPGSLRSKIREHLAAHPDEQLRPTDVSNALGYQEPHVRRQVASELGRLYRQGLVHRQRPEEASAHGPGVTYQHKAAVEPAEA